MIAGVEWKNGWMDGWKEKVKIKFIKKKTFSFHSIHNAVTEVDHNFGKKRDTFSFCKESGNLKNIVNSLIIFYPVQNRSEILIWLFFFAGFLKSHNVSLTLYISELNWFFSLAIYGNRSKHCIIHSHWYLYNKQKQKTECFFSFWMEKQFSSLICHTIRTS